MNKEYNRGFNDFCKQAGIDPQELIKLAQKAKLAKELPTGPGFIAKETGRNIANTTLGDIGNTVKSVGKSVVSGAGANIGKKMKKKLPLGGESNWGFGKLISGPPSSSSVNPKNKTTLKFR